MHACLVMCNLERVGVCVPTLTRDLFHCFSADPEHNSGGVDNVMPESAPAALTNGQTEGVRCVVCVCALSAHYRSCTTE